MQNGSTLSIGNVTECELFLTSQKSSTIDSQVILEDNFVFHIKNNNVNCSFHSHTIEFDEQSFFFQCTEEPQIIPPSYVRLKEISKSKIYLSLLKDVQNRLSHDKTHLFSHPRFSSEKVIFNSCEMLSRSFWKEGYSVYQKEHRSQFRMLIWSVWSQICEYGILTLPLADPEVSEIMVNSAHHIYLEKMGMIFLSPLSFQNDNDLLAIIERICTSVGRRIDESVPYCDARLKDGSRVHAIIPPLALNGPCLTIRKFPKESLTAQKLVELKSIPKHILDLFEKLVASKKNILISGGTGSGKTTLLNCLSSFIPNSERIITIEDSAELKLQQEHVIRLESRAENIENKGRITMRDLVKNSLRMRPDRIIVGECRGGEALDMLQAMNTGHDGSMTTIHANSPMDALRRLETLVLFAEYELPSKAIREQITSAIHYVIQQSRLANGHRCITAVHEILGMCETSGKFLTHSLYEYESI